MSSAWPAISYTDWAEACDTLHALTQLLGKLAVALAPPEPQLQHAALRLTARGWETAPLRAPDGSGSVVVALDLHEHRVRIEHSAGVSREIPLVRGASVAEVTREVLAAIRQIAGEPNVSLVPQEVPWRTPLDKDTEHAGYDPEPVATYMRAAAAAALVLAEFRAPYRGRSTPVNAWWGSFDLAVSLFSGEPALPPSNDFIMRNAMDSQEVALGWWPGDRDHPGAAFYVYAHPAPEGFSGAELEPAQARWDEHLGEYVLDWSAVIGAPDPRAAALAFMRSAFSHACSVCGWDPGLARSAEADPPPLR